MAQSVALKSGTGISEINALTGIRGIAALYVVLYHIEEEVTSSTFFKHGYISVDLFFILSGFLMAMTYASRFLQTTSVKNYFLFLNRRFARIYPLYLFATLCTLVARRAAPDLLLSNLLMVQNWGHWRSMDGPAWSISVEWTAYLVFPILIAILYRSRAGFMIGAALSYGAVVWLCFFAWHAVPQVALNIFMGPYALLRCVAEFSMGIATYRMVTTPVGQYVLRNGWVTIAVSAAIFIALFSLSTDMLLVSLFPLLVLGISGASNPVSRFLGSPPVHYLGLLSYSLYLLHRPIYAFLTARVQHMWPVFAASESSRTIIGFAGLLFILLICVGTYHGLEVPARNLLRRMFEGPSAKPARHHVSALAS